MRLSSRESTGPEQLSGLSSPPLRFSPSQPQREVDMELVFVHESGHLGFDGASDTSEESNEDEAGWGRSSSGAGEYSTMRGCAFSVEGSRPRLEEVSFYLDIEVS